MALAGTSRPRGRSAAAGGDAGGATRPLVTFTDANVYDRAAGDGLFEPYEGRTAGYPLVLRTLRRARDPPVLPRSCSTSSRSRRAPWRTSQPGR